MNKTRARRLRFIDTVKRGPYTLQETAERLLARHGQAWLTDEQIADITRELCRDVRDVHRAQIEMRLSRSISA